MANPSENIDWNICSNEVKISRLNWQRVRAAVGLVNQSFPVQPQWEWAALALPVSLLPAVVHRAAGIKQIQYWVAISGQSIMGVTGLYSWQSEPGTCWIGWTVVAPGWRRRGIGTKLFDTVTHAAQKQQYQKLKVYTSAKSIAAQIYEKRGFRTVSQIGDRIFYEIEISPEHLS